MKLVSTIHQLFDDLHATGNRVTITWIPGHANIRGNERADQLARTATLAPTATLWLPLQRTAITAAVASYVKEATLQDHRRELAAGSKSATWYQRSTKLGPSPVSRNTPRWLAVTISRLRLGYPSSWEVVERRPRDCEHCGLSTQVALEHYLLECEYTEAFRAGEVVDEGMSAAHRAATVAATVMENLEDHIDNLRNFPPPR